MPSREWMIKFVVVGTPVSQQARRRQWVRDWISKVSTEVRTALTAPPPLADDPVSIEITCYYDQTRLDVDNIAKPILDAIKGVILNDDEQVVELVVRKHVLRAARAAPKTPRVAEALLLGGEFVHVVVRSLASRGELG